ncbi:hypothetical protein H0H93_000373, partial [Arthromyces matolae]
MKQVIIDPSYLLTLEGKINLKGPMKDVWQVFIDSTNFAQGVHAEFDDLEVSTRQCHNISVSNSPLFPPFNSTLSTPESSVLHRHLTSSVDAWDVKQSSIARQCVKRPIGVHIESIVAVALH